jgi:hypothetical protein
MMSCEKPFSAKNRGLRPSCRVIGDLAFLRPVTDAVVSRCDSRSQLKTARRVYPPAIVSVTKNRDRTEKQGDNGWVLEAEGRLLGAGFFSAFVPQTAIDSSDRRRNIYSITIGRLVESVGPTYLRKGGWHGCREWRKCQLWKKPELLVAYPG